VYIRAQPGVVAVDLVTGHRSPVTDAAGAPERQGDRLGIETVVECVDHGPLWAGLG
jgi:hypothetical protein